MRTQTRYFLGMIAIGVVVVITIPIAAFIGLTPVKSPEISAQEYNWVLLDLTDDSAFNSSPSGKAYRSLLKEFMDDGKVSQQEFRRLTSIRMAYLDDRAESRLEQIHAAILEALKDGTAD